MHRIGGSTRGGRRGRTAFVGFIIAGLVAGSATIAAAPATAATSWTVTPSPSPVRPPPGTLAAVSCASPTSCTAVGSSFSGSTPRSLAERFDGKSWTIIAAPTAGGASSSILSGVSCASVTSCDAVGSSSNGAAGATLAEHWDGAVWAVVPTPALTGASTAALSAVTCAASCTAVGRYSAPVSSNSFDSFTLVEQGV